VNALGLHEFRAKAEVDHDEPVVVVQKQVGSLYVFVDVAVRMNVLERVQLKHKPRLVTGRCQ
jgi:hypothetical protein